MQICCIVLHCINSYYTAFSVIFSMALDRCGLLTYLLTLAQKLDRHAEDGLVYIHSKFMSLLTTVSSLPFHKL